MKQFIWVYLIGVLVNALLMDGTYVGVRVRKYVAHPDEFDAHSLMRWVSWLPALLLIWGHFTIFFKCFIRHPLKGWRWNVDHYFTLKQDKL